MNNIKVETGLERDYIKNRTLIIKEPVEKIADRAFQGRKDIDIVVLPNSIKSIGFRAFYESSIKEIIFPEGLRSIHTEAFENCRLTRVQFPTTLFYIGKEAFRDNNYLTEVDFNEPQALYIGTKAFYNDNIKILDIPSIVKLGNNVFSYNKLKYMKISESLLKESLAKKLQGPFINNPEVETAIFQETDKNIPPRKVKKITKTSKF